MRVPLTLAVSLLLLPALPVAAADLPMRDFSYHEGFEQGDSPVLEWVTNGEYQTNFMGITDEMAHEGTHSFKLDITLVSGSYHYFHVPVRVPLEGECKFSGWFYIAQGDNVSATLGLNMAYPPTRHSGVGGFNGIKGPTGEWKSAEGDLVATAGENSAGIMARYADGATSDNVGRYMDRWGLFIKGGTPGERVVVYVDDIRVEGRVPEEEAYQAEIARRWQGFEDKWGERLTGWRVRVDAAEQAMARIADLPEQLSPIRDSADGAMERSRTQLAEFERVGYAMASEVDTLQGDITAAEQAPVVLAQAQSAVAEGRRMLLFQVPAMSNNRVLPTGLAVPGEPLDGLDLSACAGEYESASIVLFPIQDTRSALVSVGPLTGDAGTIPAEAVDVKLVKVWYQAGRSIGDLKHKQLVPELLLNDDALVRVDTEAEENYLRSTGEDGTETYMLASDPDPESGHLDGVRPVDAEALQPIDLPPLRVQQYWITVHVPEGAAPGQYRGVLQVTCEGGEPLSVPMVATVHPFALAPSPLTYSVYYRAKLTAENQPAINSEHRSEEQYLAEMRHLAAHGVLYPTIYQNYDEELLPRALELRKQAGLGTDQLFGLGVSTGAPQDEAELNALRERVRQCIALAREHGYRDIYFYGIDEASGDRLIAQRAAWEAVQAEGGHTFVAGYKGTFEAMGALLNVAVLAHVPNPAEAVKFHSVGSRVFCYANPQVGPEESETFRRNYGLVLWQAGFDGCMDYAYQHGFGHVWNDFDSVRYRDHNFAYPTINGVVGTVQIEGYREACDDVRYMATLLKSIEDCRDPGAKAAARQWVDELDPQRDLDQVRAEMVQHILRCKGLD